MDFLNRIQSADIFDVNPGADLTTYHNLYDQRTDVKYTVLPLDDFRERIETDPITCIGWQYIDTLVKRLPNGAVLAGGFVAALLHGNLKNASDIDIWVTKVKDKDPSAVCEDIIRALIEFGYSPDGDSAKYFTEGRFKNGLKYGSDLDKEPFLQFRLPPDVIVPLRELPLQVIKISWYDDAEHVVDNYDFTCLQFAIDCGTREVVFNPVAPLDYANRRLVVHRQEPERRFRARVEKYLLKGFKAPAGYETISAAVG